ncbi:MAG: molybdate ABC transporter substrate-binding protein [Pseudomonadota bacterium]
MRLKIQCWRWRYSSIVGALCALLSQATTAAEIHVAVAANFIAPMQQIAADFASASGHKLLLSFASTGQLYAQIKHGAPFEVLLAADQETPARLEQEGLAVPGSRFTYAVGSLVLWSKQATLVDQQGMVLQRGYFQHLALADPKRSPYGAASIEVLRRLGQLERLQPKFVQGENIAQTYQFVASENAELGFVARAQVFADGVLKEGSAWIVPSQLHSPITQDAVTLKQGQGKPAVSALVDYLRSAAVRQRLRFYGYQ